MSPHAQGKPCGWLEMMSSGAILSYGKDARRATKTPLRAGPLTMVYHHGDLRWIHLGKTEIIQRIYSVVRGAKWETLPQTISNLSIHSRTYSFLLSCDCESRNGEVDFRWGLRIEGLEDGTIHWQFDGQAFSAFSANRIGLCVLHPIAECAGKNILVTTTDGDTVSGRFPVEIAPWPLFTDAAAISYTAGKLNGVQLSLTGDGFEAEDQRNWTDASFKTYSRPLRLPYPFHVRAGATIRQTLDLTLRTPRTCADEFAADSEVIIFRVSERSCGILPQIGLGISHTGSPLPSQTELLQRLALSFLSVEYDPLNQQQLKDAVAQSKALKIPLEVRLANRVLPWKEEQDEVAELLEGATVCRWLVDVGDAEPPSDLSTWTATPGSPEVLFGSGRGFVHVNRNRAVAECGDGVWFSINPQSHATDDDSLVENLVAQGWVVEQARRLSKDSLVSVSRVTLKPPAGDDLSPDFRQWSLFGAAWTVGSLKHLAESGAHSISYFETVGTGGVVPISDEPDCSVYPVYPVYHVFRELAGLGGGEVLASTSSQPLLVEGLAIRSDECLGILLANFSEESKTVSLRIDGIDGICNGMSSRCLNETSCRLATEGPERYHEMPSQPLTRVRNEIEVTIPSLGLLTMNGILRDRPNLQEDI